MPTKRGFLKLIGGGVVVAAGIGAAGIVAGRPSQSARAPWKTAGQYDDYRERALSYALLAPNPHNLQPWLVRLDGENALTLFHDSTRRLPVTDPYDRQITIGCGAFLEILSLAALEEGKQARFSLFPEGENMQNLDTRPVARVEFVNAPATPDPLFQYVTTRRSNKSTYKTTPIESEKLGALNKAGNAFGLAAKMTNAAELTQNLRKLTWDAHVREAMTPAAHKESVDLMRIGRGEVSQNPDGIEMEGTMIELARSLGILNPETLVDTESSAFKQGLDMYQEKAMSAQAFGWLANDNATRADQIDAGRAYVRVNLKATELGLAMHPWSQALQEYEEMQTQYKRVHQITGEKGRIQMLFRLG